LFAILLLASCAVSSAPPKPTGGSIKGAEPPVFAVPGEAMEYRISLRGIVVGKMRVAIGEPGWTDGKRSLIVRSRGETDGVLTMIGKLAYELKSTIDLDRGLPIINHEESWAELAVGDKEHDQDTDEWSSNDDHHDAHSAVGRFRGWRSSQPGERIALDVRVGGARLDLEAWHAAREYLPSVKAQAVRYDGVIAAEYAFSAWVSDDPSRVPLRFTTSSKWGAIAAELVAYHASPDAN
jgi:hypothetical protein